jgi:biotin carboxylase
MRVLILGVGNAQLDAIALCKARGHEVFAISYRDEGRGRQLADHFAVVNVTDEQRVLEYARSIGAGMVYSVGSDVAMPTASFVSTELGLPHFVDAKTARLLQDKSELRSFLATQGISPLAFRSATKLQDLDDWTEFPAILKPVDSQGQRGVSEAANRQQLEATFDDTLAQSRSGRVIVEQYVEGPEISLNAFVLKGKLMHAFVSDRYSVQGLPGGIVRAHALPSEVEPRHAAQATKLASQVVRALGIRNGPVYFQLKCGASGVVVIEVAPRLDGCHLWRLIKLGTGIDLLTLTFDTLEGIDSTETPRSAALKSTSGARLLLEFFLAPPNIPCNVHPRTNSADLYTEWYYSPGEIVRPINGRMEKLGYRIVASDTGLQAAARLEGAQAQE